MYCRNHSKMKIFYLCKEKFEDKHGKEKKCKVRDHCNYADEYRDAPHRIKNFYSFSLRI